MPRTCTICRHLQRESIDAKLLNGEPLRGIAKHTATSPTALWRHRRDHIPQSLTRALELSESEHDLSVLEQVEALRDKALDIMQEARQQGDLRTALAAVAQTRGLLELLWRAEQEVALEEPQQQSPFINLANVVITPHSGPVYEGEDDGDDVIDVSAGDGAPGSSRD